MGRQVLLPKYRLGKKIGIGSFGKVKLARHILTGQKVAIKILKRQNLTDAEAEKVKREIKLMGAFSHPHIVRLYEVIETEKNIYIVMEYMNHGELFDFIIESGRLQENDARYIFGQIISGVQFCHLNNVVHRDLKPENLLMNSTYMVKIADFGLGNVMHDGHFLKTHCGSPNYAAPEVISRQLYAGPEVDIWSCGVILYVLLCGRLPFDEDSFPLLYEKIKRGMYTLPSNLSQGARDLIAQILVVDPMKRITIPQMLQHSWLRDHLPRLLTISHEQIIQRAKKIDEDVLQEVIKLGFNRDHVIDSFHNRTQNEATACYYLLVDNWSRGSNLDLQPGSEELYGTRTLQWESTSSITRSSLLPQHMDEQGASTLNSQLDKNWTIGVQSQARPHDIIMDVLSALQLMNACWKMIGHYNIKCRWLPRFNEHPGTPLSFDLNREPTTESSGLDLTSQSDVKFEMQIYKTTGMEYIIDLQRVHGPPILFLEVCAVFRTQFFILLSGVNKGLNNQ